MIDLTTRQGGLSHVLYSRGRLFDEFDYVESLSKLSNVTRRTEEQVEQRLLSGEQRRVKSSYSLKKIMRLEKKLKSLGLDVFIEVEEYE